MAVERLVVFPESGRVVPEFKDVTIREIIHRPCRIVYRIKAGQNRVEIAIPSMGVMKLRLCNADQRF
jgi:plasmid stabilization system protein ParE